MITILLLSLVGPSLTQDLPLPPIEEVTGYITEFGALYEAFPESIDEALDMVQNELCYDSCNGKQVLDCDCQNAFLSYNSGRDECSNLPCNLFRTFREELRGTMAKMMEATSYAKLVKAALPLADQLLRQLCDCSDELPLAIQGCLTGRSPAFADIQESLKNVRWGAVGRIWDKLRQPFCSEECGLDATLHLTKIARIIDETQASSGSCMDINNFVQELVSSAEGNGFESAPDVQAFLDEAGDQFWCGGSKNCRRKLESRFSTCCYGELLETFDSDTLRDVRRIIRGFMDEDPEDLRGFNEAFNAIVPTALRALDPDQARCSRQDRDCSEFF